MADAARRRRGSPRGTGLPVTATDTTLGRRSTSSALPPWFHRTRPCSPALAAAAADEIAAVRSDPHVGLGERVEGPTDTGVRASVIEDGQLGEDTAVPEANPSCSANVGYRLLDTGGRETTLDRIASRERDRDAHQHASVQCHHQPSSRERPSASSVHTELIQAREETAWLCSASASILHHSATCRRPRTRYAFRFDEQELHDGHARCASPRDTPGNENVVGDSAASVTASQGRPR